MQTYAPAEVLDAAASLRRPSVPKHLSVPPVDREAACDRRLAVVEVPPEPPHGSAVGWGYNAYGELGDGAPSGAADMPVAVSDLSNATGISAGEYHSLAAFSPTPRITNVNPDTGPAAGGTTVTVTGTGFAGATALQFGATNATSFTVQSATRISAVSPVGTGTKDVTVTTPEGSTPKSSADRFAYVSP